MQFTDTEPNPEPKPCKSLRRGCVNTAWENLCSCTPCMESTKSKPVWGRLSSEPRVLVIIVGLLGLRVCYVDCLGTQCSSLLLCGLCVLCTSLACFGGAGFICFVFRVWPFCSKPLSESGGLVPQPFFIVHNAPLGPSLGHLSCVPDAGMCKERR